MSSDSDDLEVDFPHYPPNQPHKGYLLIYLKSPIHQQMPQQRSHKSKKTQQTFLLRDQEKQGNNKNHNTPCTSQQKM